MPTESASTLRASWRTEKVRSRGQGPGWGDLVWASLPLRLPAPRQEGERLLTPARPPVGLAAEAQIHGRTGGRQGPQREKDTVLEAMASFRGPGPPLQGHQASSLPGWREKSGILGT